MMRQYRLLPDIPDSGLLDRYLDTLGIIAPLARTNLVTNPSFETATTGYAAGAGTSIARSTTYQYHGAYSLAATYGGIAGSVTYDISLTSGTTYVLSMKFIDPNAAGRTFKISIASNVGVDQSAVTFTATGRWQWVWVVLKATSTATHQLKMATVSTPPVLGGIFYIDGVQLEAISDGYNVPTTYIDGDQLGLVPNQYPAAYGWNGTPHASTSHRIAQTRAGGRIVRFRDLGFLLTTIIGLGMAPPTHQALTFAQLDGGQYQNTLKPPRQFSLAGRVTGIAPNDADSTLSQLSRLLDRDLVAQRQPLMLTTQAQSCGAECGDRVMIPALYSGGLEGQIVELPTAQVPITFQQYIPFVTGRDGGEALDPQDTITMTGIVKKAPGGEWSNLSTGVTGGGVNAIVVGLNGLVYVGGSFTAAGATSADFVASYNPLTDTWAVLGSATALNNTVNALAVGPDGRIYVGGAFTNANGIAAADFIAVWDPNASTWAALSTGMDNTVNALAWSGATLYAGGNFTTAGGGAAARVASWNGSAWSAMGTGANTSVEALAARPGGGVYIGGAFTNGGGVAAADYIGLWNGSAWSGLSTGMNLDVNALAVGLNGLLYAGGVFTTAGGVTAGGIAVWNGVGWQQLGSGFVTPGTDTPNGFAVLPNGQLLIAASGAVVDPGNPGSLFMWNGSAYVSLGLRIASGSANAVAVAPDGTIYAGAADAGTTLAAANTTVTNNGTAEVFPVVTIYGPSSSTSRIYQLVNETTGRAIYFNLTLSAGEIATLTLNPTNVTFTSTFQGNILNTILPGSMTTLFSLQPGANTISFLAASSTVNPVMRFGLGYNNLNDALYQAVAP